MTPTFRLPWQVPVAYPDGGGPDIYGAKTEKDARALAEHLRAHVRPGALVLEPVESAAVWAALEQLAAARAAANPTTKARQRAASGGTP